MIPLDRPLEDIRHRIGRIETDLAHLRHVVDTYTPADLSGVTDPDEYAAIVDYDNARIVGARRNLAQTEAALADYQAAARLIVAEQLRTMADAFCGGYHPDTDPREYTSCPDGYYADVVERITVDAFDAGLDVYGIALDAAHAGIGR